MFEKPPAESPAAVSGNPFDAPTEVTKGQVEGKVGINVVQEVLPEPATPPSPEEKRRDTPRAPSWAYLLHKLLRGGGSAMCTRSMT